MKTAWKFGPARLDAFCARLNSGLSAVALVLGILVLMTAAVRAVQYVNLDHRPLRAAVSTALKFEAGYD